MVEGDGTARASGLRLALSSIASEAAHGAEPENVPPEAHARLTSIVTTQILPRLVALHAVGPAADAAGPQAPTRQDVERLSLLVLDPDPDASCEFVAKVKARGLSTDGLFVNLLEPAARCLGSMWDNDECSFVDVTLGVGRLQHLLSLYGCSFAVPAFSERRRACMMSIADDQHSFGASMVAKFLRAGGWEVQSERCSSLQQIAPLMRSRWFAVVGLTASSDRQLDLIAATIHQIRIHSRNQLLGIMVGGPVFSDCPGLAAQVGADATALSAPAAVLLAQRLFDIGAESDWQGSFSEH